VSTVADAVPFDRTAPPAVEQEELPEEIADPVSVPPDRLLTFQELPQEIRAALKELTITGHIYSSDHLLRRLNVNDGMWREGDSLPGGVTIEEVTEGGAVFLYSGYRFSMEVHP
jgi:hypothetical protein